MQSEKARDVRRTRKRMDAPKKRMRAWYGQYAGGYEHWGGWGSRREEARHALASARELRAEGASGDIYLAHPSIQDPAIEEINYAE